MRSLELMYYVIRQQALAVRSSESDYLPSMALTVMLHPIFFAAINLLLGLSEKFVAHETASSIIFAKYGVWFYASLGFAYLFVKFALDARQSQIDQKFKGFRPGSYVRIAFVFSAFLFSILSHYFNTIHFAFSLAAFGVLFLALHLYARNKTKTGVRVDISDRP